MAEADFSDEWIEASAAALGLPLAPEWRAAIRTNLKVTPDHGMRAASFPLPDDAEPSPVFEA